jgi:chemotaxis protein MotB
MAKKCKCPDCIQKIPGWLVTFGDLMSLLLVFFILLLSMSTMDAKKVSEAIGSLSGAMSVLDGGIKTTVSKKRIQEATPIEDTDETTEIVNRVSKVINEVNEIVKMSGGQAIALDEGQDGFIIEMPASMLFRRGSAEIESDDAILFLKRVALIIDTLPNNIEVIARGHTDNAKLPSDSPFDDHWELSGARSVSVIKELIRDGVKAAKMSAAAHAYNRPIATNATPQGRARNRRVELHFMSKDKNSENRTKTSILDQ